MVGNGWCSLSTRHEAGSSQGYTGGHDTLVQRICRPIHLGRG
jgi:hypothetical protein